MKKYNCVSCNFHTNHKPNFERHLKTNKHKESTKSQHLVNQKSTFSQPFFQKNENIDFSTTNSQTITPFQCKYCEKYFKFKQSMYKHIKYTCKKNKDEDLKELARLMNEKDKQLVLNNSQLEKMQKQIDKLSNKLQMQNVNNGTINNFHNTINIQLLNHGDTDYSHITPFDYISCIESCNKCVKNLIEKVHFNSKKPENMNIYLSNVKGKYIMIYKNDTWQIQDKKKQIEDLYDQNENVLENWYDEYKEKYPHIIKSFQRYLKNRDEDDLLNHVKEEILLMLYNNRKMIPNE